MTKFARIISWIGHPLVFVTISVAIVLATQLASQTAIPLFGIMLLAVIAPMGVLLFIGIRSGRWKDADVSVRSERKRFYPIAIPLSAAGTVVMWLAGAPRGILRGGVITLCLLAIAALINLWFKISFHALLAAFCTVVLFRVSVGCGAVALVLAALVCWSRLVLARHTVSEIVAGFALGASGGMVTAWMSI